MTHDQDIAQQVRSIFSDGWVAWTVFEKLFALECSAEDLIRARPIREACEAQFLAVKAREAYKKDLESGVVPDDEYVRRSFESLGIDRDAVSVSIEQFTGTYSHEREYVAADRLYLSLNSQRDLIRAYQGAFVIKLSQHHTPVWTPIFVDAFKKYIGLGSELDDCWTDPQKKRTRNTEGWDDAKKFVRNIREHSRHEELEDLCEKELVTLEKEGKLSPIPRELRQYCCVEHLREHTAALCADFLKYNLFNRFSDSVELLKVVVGLFGADD